MPRGRYTVLRCPRCKGLLVADSRNRSRVCPRCKKKIDLLKIIPIYASDDPHTAASALQEISQRGSDGKPGERYQGENDPRSR